MILTWFKKMEGQEEMRLVPWTHWHKLIQFLRYLTRSSTYMAAINEQACHLHNKVCSKNNATTKNDTAYKLHFPLSALHYILRVEVGRIQNQKSQLDIEPFLFSMHEIRKELLAFAIMLMFAFICHSDSMASVNKQTENLVKNIIGVTMALITSLAINAYWTCALCTQNLCNLFQFAKCEKKTPPL